MKENKSLNSLWYNFNESLNSYRETGAYPLYLIALDYYTEYKARGGKRESSLMLDLIHNDEISDLLSDIIIEEAGA